MARTDIVPFEGGEIDRADWMSAVTEKALSGKKRERFRELLHSEPDLTRLKNTPADRLAVEENFGEFMGEWLRFRQDSALYWIGQELPSQGKWRTLVSNEVPMRSEEPKGIDWPGDITRRAITAINELNKVEESKQMRWPDWIYSVIRDSENDASFFSKLADVIQAKPKAPILNPKELELLACWGTIWVCGKKLLGLKYWTKSAAAVLFNESEEAYVSRCKALGLKKADRKGNKITGLSCSPSADKPTEVRIRQKGEGWISLMVPRT